MRPTDGQPRRACATAVAGVVASIVALAGCAETPDTSAPATVDRVVLIGDSLGEQTAPYLQSMVGELAFEALVFGGTAPCDWLGKDLTVTPTTVAIITFIGNSSSSCMADGAGVPIQGQALVDKYEADIAALIAQVRSVGARVLMVGQPQLGGPESDQEHADLNALYADVVEPGVIEFVDAGASVEDANGAFTLRLPCLPGEAPCDPDGTIAVRSEDGVHFCSLADAAGCAEYSSGAFRFAAALAMALDVR